MSDPWRGFPPVIMQTQAGSLSYGLFHPTALLPKAILVSTGPQTSGAVPSPPRGGSISARLLAVAVLATLFLSFSLVRSPIPGVNESHYLCKARHYWQPEWCRGDLFLESANPHAVFYQAFGWFTTRMSLAQAALMIRGGQSLLLAIGWLALGTRLVGDTRRALTAAALFLLLQGTGTWSGEWLVGGAESKVWAYGFLMLAAAWGLDRHWIRCAIAGGLAVSMHPVVGCWGAVIATIGWGLSALFDRWSGSPTSVHQERAGVRGPHEGLRSAPHPDPLPTVTSTPEVTPPVGRGGREQPVSDARTSPPPYDGRPRPSLSVLAATIAIFALTSLPGLIPAVQSLAAPSPQIASEADFLQVSVRLSHHLDPLTFPVRAWRDYGLLLLVLALIRTRLVQRRESLARLEYWMLAALLIAAGGVLAAWGPRPLKELPLWELRVKALKLYPFRLADMLVPLTVSFTVAVALWQLAEERLTARRRPAAIAALMAVALLIAYRVPTLDKTLAQQPAAVQTDWLSACQWVREHTPQDAVLYATNDNWSLRWYAERPEYFSFKDCPQDAASIVEWNRRSLVIYHWKLRVFSDGSVSAEDLSQLRKETGITHIICGRFGPVERKPVFLSTNISVYELP